MGEITAELGQKLSQTQRDVLNLMASGLTMKEIAEAMNITFSKAKYHQRVIFIKLGALNGAHAVAIFLRQELA